MSDDEPRPRVPLHEPETMAGEARRFRGNYDKVSSTSNDHITWHGVTVHSRYGDAEEMETMLDMVAALSPELRRRVSTIFCDSKRTHAYTVELRSWDGDAAQKIGKSIEAIAVLRNEGHNGIRIQGTAQVDFGSTWEGPDELEDDPGFPM